MVTRVYWPNRALSKFQPNEQSIALGWKNSATDFVVVTLVPYLEISLAARLLERDILVDGSEHAKKLYKQFENTKLQVLGTINHTQLGSYFHVDVESYNKDAFNLHFTGRHDGPIHVILYDPPDAEWLHYYSLSPIQLNLLNTSKLTIISVEHEKDLLLLRDWQAKMQNMASEHANDEYRKTFDTRSAELRTILKRSICQINYSREFATLLNTNAKKMFPEAIRLHELQKQNPTRARRLSISAQNFGIKAKREAEQRVSSQLAKLSWLIVGIAIALRFMADIMIKFLNYKVWRNYSLQELSATAMQVDIMLRRISYYPEQYLVIRKGSRTWRSPEYNVEYIRFYNSIWLGINDRILGFTIANFVFVYQKELFSATQYLTQKFFGDQYRDTVFWLMSWPGGLKLHDEVAVFIGGIVVWVISAWQSVMLTSAPIIQTAILVVAYVGWFGGLSLQIALASDIISFMTLHVFCFYMGSARMYRNVLLILSSLFRLFRGKKYNVLRKRIDSGDYDLGQLLMGTLIFTILLFLLPTLATFYFVFTSTRLILVLVSAGLEMTLMFLNHFPIFILLLRFKSPGRLPGGVKLELVSSQPNHPIFLRLVSQPLGMGHIFHQFNVVAQRFSKHYFSLKVFIGAMTGRHVSIQRTKLYNLLHSMLPPEQTPLNLLYQQLCRELIENPN